MEFKNIKKIIGKIFFWALALCTIYAIIITAYGFWFMFSSLKFYGGFFAKFFVNMSLSYRNMIIATIFANVGLVAFLIFILYCLKKYR